jgi:hypothetical protein
MKISLGDIVTTKVRKEAYYSNYGGRVECWFEPGDKGKVISLKVPVVIRLKGKPLFFNRVEFEKFGQVWSVALYPAETQRLKEREG